MNISFEEYDYYQGHSFAQKEGVFQDWIEGNDESNTLLEYSIIDRERKISAYNISYIDNFEDIARVIERLYPDMMALVEVAQNYNKKIKRINDYVIRARQGDEDALDYVGLYYIKNILVMTVNEVFRYGGDFYEAYDRNTMWLTEAIWDADLDRYNSIMTYVLYKRKYYRLFQQERDYLVIFPYRVNRMLTRWGNLTESYREDVFEKMKLGFEKYSNYLFFLSDYDKRKCFGTVDVYVEEIENLIRILKWKFISIEDMFADETSKLINEARYFSDSDSTFDTVCNIERDRTIQKVLLMNTEREREIITRRFGLNNGEPGTLEEIGNDFGVDRERVRQIEAKALRRLRHPRASRKLKDFLWI